MSVCILGAVCSLSHLSFLMDKGKPIFINGVYAHYEDLVRLVTDIRRGVDISTVEKLNYIDILV